VPGQRGRTGEKVATKSPAGVVEKQEPGRPGTVARSRRSGTARRTSEKGRQPETNKKKKKHKDKRGRPKPEKKVPRPGEKGVGGG